MKITIQVRANSKIEKVEKTGEQNYKFWVKAPTKENKANLAVIKLLASHFGVAKSNIEIIAGLKAKKKTILIK